MDGVRVRIGPVTPRTEPLPAGVIRPHGDEIRVGTGDGHVTLGWVQPAGRARMASADWWRGLRVSEAACD